jgi:hypothetical protein
MTVGWVIEPNRDRALASGRLATQSVFRRLNRGSFGVVKKADWRVVMRAKLIPLAVAVFLVTQLPMPLHASEIALGTSGALYTVPAQINRSVQVQFLVDPGAGIVVIPLSVLDYLVRNGTVTNEDVIGLGAAQLADSSLHLTARVRLRELRIGDTIVRDVPAAVSPALSQPLLGQSFLRRFAAVTFDNRRHVLILSDEAASAVPQPPAIAAAPYPSYPGYPASGSFSGSGYGAPTYSPGYGR